MTRRLDRIVSRFCSGSSLSTVLSYVNSLISYVEYQSGRGISAADANYIISQLETLIDALYVGTVDCGAGSAPRPLPGPVGQEGASERYSLGVFPNPFSTQATIQFYLPQAGPATLEVFNLQGQRVKVLISENLDTGHQVHRWDGAADNGERLETGIYLVRLQTENAVLVKKASFIR